MLFLSLDDTILAIGSVESGRLDVDAYTGGYNLQIAFCTAQSFANHL